MRFFEQAILKSLMKNDIYLIQALQLVKLFQQRPFQSMFRIPTLKKSPKRLEKWTAIPVILYISSNNVLINT